ncbi:MAG: AAA family ATPase [Candidatus Levybacteria bacterium]|nr:AAA family ATPase [Candidatus Levybacteria bacterium]
MQEAAQVQATAQAQATNGIIPQTPSKESKGESSDQIRALGEKIEKSPVPEELRKILDDRIARLALIRSGSGFMSSTYIMEYESTQRYVNWVTGMPWESKSQDILDLKKAKEILDRDHFGLELLKSRMLEYIASIMLNLQNNGPDYAAQSPVLCFVGLAGTGKTTFAKSIAEALGREFERIPFGGMADSRVLRGQSRFFPDAEPGQIIKRLVHAKTKNPVLLLDELDRVTETARADIMGVLIELLDPGQNNAFSDHYIDYPFNLSNSLFVATANNTSAISTAVIDRLEIITMPSYNDEEKMHIGRDYVFPKVSKLIGLKPEQLVVDEPVWEIIIRPLGYDPGIRGLERLVNMMCRKAARMIVAGEAKNIKITADNVKLFTQDY